MHLNIFVEKREKKGNKKYTLTLHPFLLLMLLLHEVVEVGLFETCHNPNKYYPAP